LCGLQSPIYVGPVTRLSGSGRREYFDDSDFFVSFIDLAMLDVQLLQVKTAVQKDEPGA
jgi:hypothetical protein